MTSEDDGTPRGIHPSEGLRGRRWGEQLRGEAFPLEAADHERSAACTGGTEWFLTSLRFLDVIAETLSRPVTVVNDPEAAD